ncbi:hypothetical protein FAI40_01495 [Acetobacteraceae bacterium]|nr:hypothetical protein FAI40_01495 [Acetobacteraceae bacterium]
MPEIPQFMKNGKRGSLFLLSCFILGACNTIHLPFLKKQSENKETAPPSDQFAPGEFSASCKPGDISVVENSVLSIGMRMVSDGKWCALEMGRDDAGEYKTFGVPVSPEHGKAYIYDGEDGVTYVAYQAEKGFEGEDHFRVFFIQGLDRPRRNIEVRVDVSAPYQKKVKPTLEKIQPEKDELN